MKHALGDASTRLTKFLSPRTLIGVDYDGTLAPICNRIGDAHMRARTRDLLDQVSRRYPVAVLTGRARIDALQFLQGLPVLEVIGSHGVEPPGAVLPLYADRVARWRGELAEGLCDVPGIEIEDKRYSLAVHYRNVDDTEAAHAQIHGIAARLEGARIVPGKQVLNVVPREAPHKGTALIKSCARLGCERVVYVGDDETDEDVFRLRRADSIFSIRVGRAEPSEAEYFLNDQIEVDDLLLAISAAR